MGRAPCCDKDGLKKGPWLPEEDDKLIDYIQKHGPGNWKTLPKKAGLQRCGKSCRLRWSNYLRPDIKRGRFSFEEEETIIQLHSILGNKWSTIATKLPGRTDNEIKNYWNTHIRKRLLRNGIDPVTHTRRIDLLDIPSILNHNSSELSLLKLFGLVNPELLKLATLVTTNPNTNENLNFLLHNIQVNQLGYNAPILNQSNSFIQTSNQNQTPVQSTNFSNFDAQNFGLQTSNYQWQSNNGMLNSEVTVEDYVNLHSNLNYLDNQAIMDPLFGNSAFQSDTSQQTPLSSNSAYPNSRNSSEDEIDSYCQNLLNFEIPVDFLDVCSS